MTSIHFYKFLLLHLAWLEEVSIGASRLSSSWNTAIGSESCLLDEGGLSLSPCLRLAPFSSFAFFQTRSEQFFVAQFFWKMDWQVRLIRRGKPKSVRKPISWGANKPSDRAQCEWAIPRRDPPGKLQWKLVNISQYCKYSWNGLSNKGKWICCSYTEHEGIALRGEAALINFYCY